MSSKKPRSEETRRKISQNNGMRNQTAKEKIRRSRTGKHWYNNGTITVSAAECPEGFVPGLLRKKAVYGE